MFKHVARTIPSHAIDSGLEIEVIEPSYNSDGALRLK